MRPDAAVPFRVASSLSPSADGSELAVAEYGGWIWMRRGPAIGKWDPPYHLIPFVPRQHGALHLGGIRDVGGCKATCDHELRKAPDLIG